MGKRHIVVLAISAMLILAGSLLIMQDQSNNQTGHSGGGHVTIDPNITLSTSPPFVLSGRVVYSPGTSNVENETFRDIRVCMYRRNGSVLLNQNIGSVSSRGGAIDISIKSEEVPYYIMVHHPGLYRLNNIENEILVLKDNEGYFDGTQTIEDMPFDVKRLSKGSCSQGS